MTGQRLLLTRNYISAGRMYVDCWVEILQCIDSKTSQREGCYDTEKRSRYDI